MANPVASEDRARRLSRGRRNAVFALAVSPDNGVASGKDRGGINICLMNAAETEAR